MRKKRSIGAVRQEIDELEYEFDDEPVQGTEIEYDPDFELEGDELELEDDDGVEYEESEEDESDSDAVYEETDEDEPEGDLSGFKSSQSNAANKNIGAAAGILSIINSKGNGKRITFSKDLFNKLSNPKSVQLSFSQNQIAIAEDLPGNHYSFSVKKYRAKGVIYSSSLVHELTDLFQLDFSNRVSITLHEVSYVRNGSTKVAIVKVN